MVYSLARSLRAFVLLLVWAATSASAQSVIITVIACPLDTFQTTTTLCLKATLRGPVLELSGQLLKQIAKSADAVLIKRVKTEAKVRRAIDARDVCMNLERDGKRMYVFRIASAGLAERGGDVISSTINGVAWHFEKAGDRSVAKSTAPSRPSSSFRDRLARDTGTPDASTVVNAYQFEYEYDHNEIQSDQWYKGKEFMVGGRVVRVARDGLGTPYVRLETNNRMSAINCSFPTTAETELAQLGPGDVVYIRGVCAGKTGDIIMNMCSLVVHAVDRSYKVQDR